MRRSIGAIEGVLIPESPRKQVVQGTSVNLIFRVQNVGAGSLAPYFYVEVIGAGSWFPGNEVLWHKSGRMTTMASGVTSGFTVNYVDNWSPGDRNVKLHLYLDSAMTQGITDGAEHWDTAYQVLAPTSSVVSRVRIIDLTIS